MRVIANTSPLIALDRIGCLFILKKMYGIIVRPQSVLDEIKDGIPTHPTSSELLNADWIVTEPDPDEVILRRELGAGETAAIMLAIKTAADLVILDDMQARIVANGLGLKITGTLGVLAAAAAEGVLPDFSEALDNLQRAGFRLPPVIPGDPRFPP
ncbi:MAG: DUF3368 domain-containing protein [Candidatus Sumerlaeota bacterium]|nr:DUF3368 domain-containing protein [Candidatus Sumerlaeota bacterium]